MEKYWSRRGVTFFRYKPGSLVTIELGPSGVKMDSRWVLTAPGVVAVEECIDEEVTKERWEAVKILAAEAILNA